MEPHIPHRKHQKKPISNRRRELPIVRLGICFPDLILPGNFLFHLYLRTRDLDFLSYHHKHNTARAVIASGIHTKDLSSFDTQDTYGLLDAGVPSRRTTGRNENELREHARPMTPWAPVFGMEHQKHAFDCDHENFILRAIATTVQSWDSAALKVWEVFFCYLLRCLSGTRTATCNIYRGVESTICFLLDGQGHARILRIICFIVSRAAAAGRAGGASLYYPSFCDSIHWQESTIFFSYFVEQEDRRRVLA